MRAVLLGPPASGKGTQAQKIKDKLVLPLLVMGDILREAVKKGGELGEKVDGYLKAGSLVPDEIVIKLIMKHLKQSGNKCFLLDGFPRTKEQAINLDESLKENQLDIVLYFSVSDSVAVERIGGRRICNNCRAVYHLINKPPKKMGICDFCNSDELIQRTDDKEDVIKKRLIEYKENTLPLLEYYKSKDILFEINAEKSIDEIFQESLNAFLEIEKKKGK